MTFSKSRAKRLGESLAKENAPTRKLLEDLEEYRSSFDGPLVRVEETLRELRFQPTTRLKTTQSIVDKVRRDRTSLSRMQDIAGARVVVASIVAQDSAVRQLEARFTNTKKKDRRRKSNHGYRAVHVVVEIDERCVEIQVRTELQDRWAQFQEKLGDQLGRGIRYGEGPSERFAQSKEVAGLLAQMDALSGTIAKLEADEISIEERRAKVQDARAYLDGDPTKERIWREERFAVEQDYEGWTGIVDAIRKELVSLARAKGSP